jgi:hypothetical protein
MKTKTKMENIIDALEASVQEGRDLATRVRSDIR